MAGSELPPRLCATCGRPFGWRRRWRGQWDRVRYCSRRCRAERPGRVDRGLEAAILELLAERPAGSSICPSEAARRIRPDAWRPLLERTRRAGRRLAAAGEIEVRQRGDRVDPAAARGAIRYALARR